MQMWSDLKFAHFLFLSLQYTNFFVEYLNWVPNRIFEGQPILYDACVVIIE